MKKINLCLTVCLLGALTSCKDDDAEVFNKKEYSAATEEWYPGGKNGTVFIDNSRAYRQAMLFIDGDAQLYKSFMRGEALFEKSFVSTENAAYSGLGPVYIRKSCIACHPSYGGRSQRVDKLDANDSRNGYLLMIYDPATPNLALAGKYFTGMTQTRAVPPYKAPINEEGIRLEWLTCIDEHGNKYADGTPYSEGTSYEGTLIYPKITIDKDAILFKDADFDGGVGNPGSKYAASIEATIGIYGVGLLDAISDEDLQAEYAAQQARGYCQGRIGDVIIESDPSNPFPGGHPGRFTYLCTRGTLDNGPGSNAIWNITNVTRPERQYHYITEEYARVTSQDAEVQTALGQSETEIFNHLTSRTLPVELPLEDYDAFMVWHRALAVPAARDLDDPQVQHGKTLFMQAGCAACHRPSWTTRSNYSPMQQLAGQKIFPYTDLLRHDLDMIEPGRVKVCRTTPLWGRGLMPVVSGHSDKLHDLRARNYEEAILWHGGEAKECKEKFRNMPKEDRHALIRFLESI
ncbi:MAG: hypothetical protein LBF89_07220 [Bacteroidales bacterium]|jgi:CxxC motif-containing protein (DUF1111 family)|nr:hypothetical protein [Bacteroidales bacterium]